MKCKISVSFCTHHMKIRLFHYTNISSFNNGLRINESNQYPRSLIKINSSENSTNPKTT